MKAFVAGLVAGAAAVGVAWWLATAAGTGGGDTPAPSPAPTPQRPDPKPARPAAVPRVRAAETGPAAAGAPADDAPFAPGEAWLRVGEGYVFGETSARRGDAAEGADIVCLDINREVALRCPGGGRMADVPLGAVGIPAEVVRAAELVTDAPADMKAAVLPLPTSSNASRPGVGLVRSARGVAYRLFISEVFHDADVLRRRARVYWAEVPSAAGGGVMRLPSAVSAKDAPTRADLKRIVEAGAALPGDSFSHFLREGDYQKLTFLPAELVIEDGKNLLLEEPLSSRVEIKGSYASLVAARGISATGKVKIGTYTGVAVRGDMAGEIEVGSYAYVHISGNLTGTLPIQSYATVVIDGDLTGEVDVASYTKLLLRGRLLGKLTIRSGNSHFWFQQYMARSTLEALGGQSNEAHLRTSDCATGTYTDVPTWSKVVVGEDAWSVIAK